MISRPSPTETYFHPTRENGDSSSTGAMPAAFVPLRLRSVEGNEVVEVKLSSAVVGRHSDADVRLLAPDVSRRHCRLFFENGVWRIGDLASLNGLFLNGDRVQEAVLSTGDKLRLGAATFVVEQATPLRGLKGKAVKHQALRSIARAIAE